MSSWNIGLSPWIIEDGNYPDLHCGQKVDFALEFIPVSTTECSTSTKSAEHLGNTRYSAIAQIAYLSEKLWVLDFGVRAFSEIRIPRSLNPGEFLAVEFYLGIDPYFYIEYLNKEQGMLPLVYSWQLDAITRQKSPLVAKPERTLAFLPDLNRTIETQVPQTTAEEWLDHDDAKLGGGFLIEYILHCSLLDENPKFKRDPL